MRHEKKLDFFWDDFELAINKLKESLNVEVCLMKEFFEEGAFGTNDKWVIRSNRKEMTTVYPHVAVTAAARERKEKMKSRNSSTFGAADSSYYDFD